ncbi:hypothetical protein OG689_24650 [Kitasatospora sp. NBC_00240]|uniref:hypothetical protein n=1 Tax=Kitasatospora sp. NBC_00240 TaxID=2903567 RepID=UPI0022564493|nr:hypothetical protein [Kitasatospora sp. NBC_00240]MCX5212435.1 hypothetical protein [Kitasatospora sp. NBC_00240]
MTRTTPPDRGRTAHRPHPPGRDLLAALLLLALGTPLTGALGALSLLALFRLEAGGQELLGLLVLLTGLLAVTGPPLVLAVRTWRRGYRALPVAAALLPFLPLAALIAA